MSDAPVMRISRTTIGRAPVEPQTPRDAAQTPIAPRGAFCGAPATDAATGERRAGDGIRGCAERPQSLDRGRL